MRETTDQAAREAFITGLRNLADFLDAHWDVPVPRYGTRIQLHAERDDDGRTEVDQFARQLGTFADDQLTRHGHYEAGKKFGPIDYRMIHITEAAMDKWHATTSYDGAVTP
jgi:hypothetical protein